MCGAAAGALGGDEVLLDLLERRHELTLRSGCDAARRVVQRVRGAGVHLFENRLRLRRQIQLHGTAVERMSAALDPARALHAVDEPRHRDRLNFETLRERCLRHALAARQVHDGAPLRLRQAQRLQPPVHVAAQQTRDVR